VGVGDIHGRFHRVVAWLEALEQARGRRIDAVLAVGDVEAFPRVDDHRRKAVKRGMPAEFSAYASGERRFPWPFYFAGGNNEDFGALWPLPEGGSLAPNVHYLGRAGVRELEGVRVGYLSGIYAPRWYELPAEPPGDTVTAWKQAGYFRRADVERLQASAPVDLLLLHEWPRGLAERGWIGNPVARKLVEGLRPQLMLCGHSHRRHEARWSAEGQEVQIACLDQASEADGALFEMTWERGRFVQGRWVR
jgi:hypothetical protein